MSLLRSARSGRADTIPTFGPFRPSPMAASRAALLAAFLSAFLIVIAAICALVLAHPRISSSAATARPAAPAVTTPTRPAAGAEIKESR